MLLPEPDGPTSAVSFPPSAWKSNSAQHRVLLAVAEIDLVEADVALGHLQLGTVRVRIHFRRGIENIVDEPHADHAALESDAGIGQALGRLVGKQDRGDERHEGAGLLRPGRSSHSRPTGSRRRRRSRRAFPSTATSRALIIAILLPRRWTDFDRLRHPRPHRGFEVERLDDPDAGGGFLHRRDDLRHAGEFGPGDGANALDQPADPDQRDRPDHDRR